MDKPIEIDIIILSYAQNENLKTTTINAVNSLMDSEDPNLIQFNVVVIESQIDMQPYQYQHTTTLYPSEAFGYHKFMNIGINYTSADFVCICNNDLIFHKNWALEILKPFFMFSDIWSASPVCSYLHPQNGFELNSGFRLGNGIREELSGWCIFFRRELLKITGQLDPNLEFWCADNDYANTLWILRLKHLLVTSSIVDHLENLTLKNQEPEVQDRLTLKACEYFTKKWNVKMGEGWTEL
jgi:GT2 family glycosyltransferase